MRKWQTIGTLVVALILAMFLLGPQSTYAADDSAYAGNHLSDYGIPDEITQVILDNSTESNGKTPTANKKTPATFTIKDIENLTTISLADVTFNPDGTVASSQTNATVAAWIAGAKAWSNGVDTSNGQAYYDIQQGVYAQNVDSAVTGPAGTLANKSITVYYGAEKVAVNFLFQIVASASSATRVDLTGVTSQVSDSNMAQSLMALFQTNRLPALKSLVLADDQLGSLEVILNQLGEYQTLFGESATQEIDALDLSNNGIASFPWSKELPIGDHLKHLNLAGNNIARLSSTINNLLLMLLSNHGAGILTDADLDATDPNTLNWMVTLMNTNTGTLALGRGAVNAIMQKAPNLIGDAAINQYLPQMTVSTTEQLLAAVTARTNTNITEDVAKAMQEYVKNGGKVPSAQPDLLAVSGTLAFGILPLGDPLGPYVSTSPLKVSATLNSGSSIYVSVTPFSDETSGQPPFTVNLNFTSEGVDSSALTVTNQNQIFYQNVQPTLEANFIADISQTTMTIPEDQQSLVRAGNYKAAVQWSIVSGPTTNAN